MDPALLNELVKGGGMIGVLAAFIIYFIREKRIQASECASEKENLKKEYLEVIAKKEVENERLQLLVRESNVENTSLIYKSLNLFEAIKEKNESQHIELKIYFDGKLNTFKSELENCINNLKNKS